MATVSIFEVIFKKFKELEFSVEEIMQRNTW